MSIALILLVVAAILMILYFVLPAGERLHAFATILVIAALLLGAWTK